MALNKFAHAIDVQQFFIEKAGRALKPIEMNRFVKDNLLDIHIEGFDIETGYGLFRLPKPETIKISDYVEDINVPTTFVTRYYSIVSFPV